ncbi:MAG TPA: cation-translocating P-type ATPase [Pelomicrobium sp.]|nr:cation-translocating P-type ATPase [Pelomicrobium sp.]
MARKAAEPASPAAARRDWHRLAPPDVAQALGVDPNRGLAPEEAARRLAEHGENAIREAPPRSAARMLLDQFTDFLIVVLLAAALISGALGEIKDAIAILVIVILNAVIGFVQEYRAQRAIAALRQMAAASASVVRGGEPMTLPATELVPGDVVHLEAGNVVPADMRLTEAARLKVEEAALTGESVPADKHVKALDEADLPLGDRRNLAFKGTTVSYGRGRGLVVATGMATELGRIAGMLERDTELKTPLQRRLAQFGRRLALVVLAICAIIFAAGLLRGEPVVLMFLTAVSLAVAAIPEALPAVVTVSLALGAGKMVRQNALIRRLPAVETLGSVTVICADKTGTLTQNRMQVEEWVVNGAAAEPPPRPRRDTPWWWLLRAVALNNDAVLDAQGHGLGDPMEVALFLAARAAGVERPRLEERMPRAEEIPFDSSRKRMTTVHRDEDRLVSFTKGAPEAVLPRCARVLTDDGVRPLDADAELARADEMARRGLRVLAFAYREWRKAPPMAEPDAVEDELTLLGLVGLMDPPRAEAKESVALARSAGIRPVMITGDHPATALAIARRIGIAGEDAEVLTGRELARLTPAKLELRAGACAVYARVDPEQKIDIVTALQRRGEIAAMTGDGVNDAPALKQADIGVAMGKGGTDVAREASAMVLLDDNFATIVAAVREGRRIYDNIRKFIKYTMTSNSGEVWTIFLAPFLGLPLPLLPIHILWINLVTDGLPGLALAVEPEEKRVMQRPPRPPQETIFAHGMWQHILWVGLLMGGVTILTQAWAYHTGSAHWQTMVFTVLTLSQLGHALAIRSETESIFTLGLLSNKPFLGAVLFTFVLQMAVIYVPLLQPVFRTEALTAAELGLTLALSTVVFFAVELEKWAIRRGWLYREEAGRQAAAHH